jgi:hypothetical protein
MKLDLLNVTAICLQGRKSDFDVSLISRLKKNFKFMTTFFNFKEIIYISDVDPEVEGVKYIHTDPISYYEYNKWCLHNMSDYITTDYALSFQDDGWPLNPELWSNEFFEYDYVGAPIGRNQNIQFHPEDRIGGGGFTLRSKKLIEFTKNFDFHDIPGGHPNEDTFITTVLRDKIYENGMKICPYHIARKFVVQMPIDDEHNLYTSFGFHGRIDRNMEISDSIITKRLKEI